MAEKVKEEKKIAEEIKEPAEKAEEKTIEAKNESNEKKTEEKKHETAELSAKAKKKNFKRRHVAKARAYILCSYNNTSITVSDTGGNVLGWSTSGSLGFKGPKKATPFAATLVAQKVVEKTARYGIKEIEIFIKGVGGGREASIRALGNAGLNINSIKDITPVPHNGCRPKKPRRV
jgi:small subunit ribosomal protein S11